MPTTTTTPTPKTAAPHEPRQHPLRPVAGGKRRSLVSKAAQTHPTLSRRGLLERAFVKLFEGFVYNQIWEDPEIDLEALELRPGAHLVTIASGGCNVLNYLTADLAQITAVDLNPAHIALTRLKLEGLRSLPDHDSFLEFFGAARGKSNMRLYRDHIRDHLDSESLGYWEKRGKLARRRIRYFKSGLYRQSMLGRGIGLAHLCARMFGVKPVDMLAAESVEDQRRIFEQTITPVFRSKLVRWCSRSPLTYYWLGIPPAQFEAMRADGQDLAQLCHERLARLACDFPLPENWFAWQAFGRRYDLDTESALPPYLRRSNFEMLRGRTSRVETRLVSMTDLLAAKPAASVDGYVLLDAQDWMNEEQITALWEQIGRTAAPGARVVFRTAGLHTPLPAKLPARLLEGWDYLEDVSKEMHGRDRSAIYGGFHLYVRKAG